MNVLIVEDEMMAQANLARALTQHFPDVRIVGTTGSVRETVLWLRTPGNSADVIFMDVELSDGDCFEIFRQADVTARVIMTTAYDNYAVRSRSTASTTCSNRSTSRRCGVPWNVAVCGAGASTPTYC